jgi:enoyl-CoA hydratase/carnithine racemase
MRSTAPSNLITLAVNGGIALMTLNDVASRNSMSFDMMDALQSVCAEVNSSKDIRVLILTGAGDSFSAGGNMDDMTQREGIFALEDPLWARDMNVSQVHKIPNSLYGLQVPTIAAVNGHAIGGGCDLALMCDIRISSEKAVFAESFLRVGLVPGDGGAWFLPRVVGLSRAMEMALTCDFIDAATAEKIGLVSRVVAHDRLMEEAQGIATRIARHPPEIARLTKRLMRFGAQSSLADTLELTASMQGMAQTSKAHREAARKVAATMKKRSD